MRKWFSLLLVLVAGFGGMGKSLSWITLGSLNAKIIQEIASDNVGEFYAKLAVVNTLGQSMGMVMGLVCIKIMPVSPLFVIGFGVFRYVVYNKMYTRLYHKVIV